CWANEFGYNCCANTTKVLYEDSTGKWGIENKKWCGIKEELNNLCWSYKYGYPCCKKTKIIYTIDKYGSWGYENNKWCGI
ncbi:Non-catalytic module family DOC2, partial [Piromyces sp. E2]